MGAEESFSQNLATQFSVQPHTDGTRTSRLLERSQDLLRRGLTEDPIIRSLGLLGASVALGLYAQPDIHADMQARLTDWATDRLTGFAGINTGPTDADHVGAEALSHIALAFAFLYAGGAGVYARVSHSKDRRLGVAEMPNGWKNHVAIIDPSRSIFDQFGRLLPERNLTLVHDGRLLREGEMLEGGQLTSKRRRHLNAMGASNLADEEVLSRLITGRPGKVRRKLSQGVDRQRFPSNIIFNLWTPDRGLYSSEIENGEIAQPQDDDLTPEKVDGMARMLLSMSKGKRSGVDVIAPRGMQIDFHRTPVELDFHMRQFHILGDVRVIHPEDIVADRLANGIRAVGRNKVAVLSHAPFQLMDDLERREIEVVGSEKARVGDLVIVHLPKDDLAIAASASLIGDGHRVVTLLEDGSNVSQVQRIHASPLLIPEVVADHVIQSWQNMS